MQLTKRQRIINFTVTFIQYFGFGIFILWSPLLAKGLLWQIIELMGIALAVWAVAVMQKSKINITPQPRKNAKLIRKGPYTLIRHPMYTSIIIAISPLIITHWDTYRFIYLMFLYFNLIIKLLFEETLLEQYFEDYKEYKTNSWRIIPYIF